MLGMHADYHLGLYRLICDSGLALSDMFLSESLLEEWHQLIAQEAAIGRVVKASADTSRMLDQVARHDCCTSYITRRIRLAAVSTGAAEFEAGKQLLPVAQAFVGITRQPARAQSTLVRSLLTRLRAPSMLPHVHTLALEQALHELGPGRRGPHKSALARMDDPRPKYRQLRPQTDAVLVRV